MDTPTNEAADRLHAWIRNAEGDYGRGAVGHNLADKALAAERRATVERIRERFASWPKDRTYWDIMTQLDEQAAR